MMPWFFPGSGLITSTEDGTIEGDLWAPDLAFLVVKYKPFFSQNSHQI